MIFTIQLALNTLHDLELDLVTCMLTNSLIDLGIHCILFVLVKTMSMKLLNISCCIAYRTHRAVLCEALSKSIGLVSLVNSKYVCKLLLYGDPKYSWNTNKMIIEATIEYLLTSKRFDVPLIHDQ